MPKLKQPWPEIRPGLTSKMSIRSEAVLVVPPKKKAISIRVDEDVLDYFKKEGAGYQRRMNAVLRSYMQQKRKKRA